jgi:hypothetical protein
MCKCKWFTLTQDLHAIYMAIDTYTHNTSLKVQETLKMLEELDLQ